jgi:hypothetical protein
MGAFDLGAKHVIALGPRRPLAGISKAGGMFMSGRWGDCQFAADRLDPQVLVMGVDESHHHLSRRQGDSGSLRLRKICQRLAKDLIGAAQLVHFAFEQFGYAALRVSRALSSDVCAAGALRRLASSRHQRRSVSVVQPILPAINVSAAQSEA